jgi:hypothetical protein
MATTNLITKSLGDILTESGNGTPDHVSPIGSLYVDKDSALLYQNIDGTSAGWRSLVDVAYGHGYYQDNTNATTISTTNTWTAVGNNFTEGNVIGFSASTDTLVLISGYDGEYEISGDITIDYVAGTNNYEVGLSINGANPENGSYNGSLVDATYTRQCIGFDTTRNLTGGTTLELAVRNLTNTDNIIIRHAQLYARKTG